jgi:aminoglycoside 6-adenylyltransferase
VHIVMLVGSQARTDHEADAFSDIDLVLTVDDPELFLRTDEWLGEIGFPICQVVEPTAFGGMSERRVLVASGQDVDFSIVSVEMVRFLGEFRGLAEVREVFGRGVRVLIDRVGIEDDIAMIESPEPDAGLLSEGEYHSLSNSFWYQLIVATKKWRRQPKSTRTAPASQGSTTPR